jgi:hypothetical protein
MLVLHINSEAEIDEALFDVMAERVARRLQSGVLSGFEIDQLKALGVERDVTAVTNVKEIADHFSAPAAWGGSTKKLSAASAQRWLAMRAY